MDKFQEKYRITSTRLKDWDYASCGMYFITICTKNREHYFGEIAETESRIGHFEMQCSEIGRMVEREWLKTLEIRPDMNLSLGEFQVMPNHFHAILIIGKSQFNLKAKNDNRDKGKSVNDLKNPLDVDLHANPHDFNDCVNPRRDAMPRVSFNSESESKSVSESDSESDYIKYMELEALMMKKNKFGPQSKNLASIIRGFKSAVKIFALENNLNFGWQPGYYDHVIRGFEDYERISKYIVNNLSNWKEDHLR